MLSVRGLSKRFGKVTALTDFTANARDGEAVGLVGPNGAGKTTALRAMCGILAPDAGQVVLDGHDMATDPVAAKRVLGYVPEIPYPFPNLTVWEHLVFFARAYSLSGWEARAEGLLRDFDLATKRDELAKTLSKGMKEKVMVMAALLHEPRVLLLDEPLYGIDPRGAYALKRHVRTLLARGTCALVSSHTLSLIEELCQRVIILHEGRVLASGTLPELRSLAAAGGDASLEEVFVRVTGGGGRG